MKLKNTLLVTALASVMAAPVMAEDVHKVYGQVNISMDSTSLSGDGLTGSAAFVGRNKGMGFKSNASRFGLMGSMDTNLADARLTYVAEMEYTTVGDAGTGAEVYGREATVGLNSKKLGNLRMGRLTPMYKANYAAIDPWTDHVLQARAGGQQGASSLNANYFNNAIEYRSPSFSGIDFSAFYSVMHDNSSQKMHNAGQLAGFIGGSASGFGLRYLKDGIRIALDTIALNSDKDISGTSLNGTMTYNTKSPLVTSNFGVDKRNKNGTANKLTAEYKTKTFSVAAHYEDATGINHGTNMFAVGTYKMGNTMLTASYGVNQGDKKSVFGEKDATTMGVGAKYKLNKSSDLIAGYSTHERAHNTNGARTASTLTVGIDAKFGY